MEPKDTAHGRVGLRFARHLVGGHLAAAHAMLGEGLARELTVDELARRYREMTALATDRPTVEVMETLDAWPAKEPGDIGWAYVAISGERFSEAVTVVVARVGRRRVVRSVEWGRP